LIVNIIGGLGNQMFQYAFAYAASQKKNVSFKLDLSGFKFCELREYALTNYGIDAEVATVEEVERLKYLSESLVNKYIRALTRGAKPLAESYYKEAGRQFDDNVYNQDGDVYFSGYWQSEKYFQDYREDLLRVFTLQESLNTESVRFKQKILDKKSVSLHVRRGDYVTNARANSFHGTCDLEYYRNAALLIQEQVTQAHFFIFSDDLAWAKENLKFIDNMTLVELEKGTVDHEEMYLMSQCRHNVIANSSFSWWGAWLNENPTKIVIAPKQWFKDELINTPDLIPSAWIRL